MLTICALLASSSDENVRAIKIGQLDFEDELVDQEMEAIMQSAGESADLEVEEADTKNQPTPQNKDKKFEEVNNLMNKYDSAEKRAKWLRSPEYAKQK